MRRVALSLFLGAVFAVAAMQAQNRMSEEARTAYQPIKSNILKAAEKMPESEYSFKPAPEVRTFGQLVAHVAEAQTAICVSPRECRRS